MIDAHAREVEQLRQAVRTSPLRGARATMLDAQMRPLGELQPLGFTITPAENDEFEAAWERMRDIVTDVSRQISVTFELVGVAARAAQAALFGAFPATPPAPETPQARALPRPAKTPPMWANDPTRSRRKRR